MAPQDKTLDTSTSKSGSAAPHPSPLPEGEGAGGDTSTSGTAAPHPSPLPEGEGDSTCSPGAVGTVAVEPLDPQVTSIQPGGGVCMRIELAWGRLRRRYLKTFRRGYLARMAAMREGTVNRCPHDVLDPRDLKFYRNQGGYYWKPEDDPFLWREHLPFVREGLAELELLLGLFVALAIGLGLLHWSLAVPPAVVAVLVVWFFRNPRRVAPAGAGLVVAPADGKVVAIEEVEFDEFVGGPAVTIGIFLSIFNVHINRMPVAGRVIGVRYRPGKFLNALGSASARENEQLALRIEESRPPYRRMVVRQIAGQFARRIVCFAAPGEEFAQAARFGMIKLGSRTELVLPREPGLAVRVSVGQRVQGRDDRAGGLRPGERRDENAMKLRIRLRKRQRWFPVLPTLITLGNAVCGFGAITFAFNVGPEGSSSTALYDGLSWAALLVYLGMVFDMLDGHMARLTKQTSNFGAELDSMCDVITFGVAPPFIMLKFSQMLKFPPVFHPRLLWVIAVLYALCAVLRLARFNVESEDQDSHDSFSGLPSPAAAGTVASFAIILPGLQKLTESHPVVGAWLTQAAYVSLPLATLAVACLMVSRIRYPHYFNQLFRGRRNFQHLVQLTFALVAIFAVHELAIPLIFIYFVLASPLRAFGSRLVMHRLPEPPKAAPEFPPPAP